MSILERTLEVIDGIFPYQDSPTRELAEEIVSSVISGRSFTQAEAYKMAANVLRIEAACLQVLATEYDIKEKEELHLTTEK